MTKKTIRQAFTIFACALLIFTLPPICAFATESSTEETVMSEAILSVQSKINEFMTRYGVLEDMSTEEIAAAVAAMDNETYRTALWEITEIENSDELQQLSEDELQALQKENPNFFVFYALLNERYESDDSVSFFTVYETNTTSDIDTVLDGSVSVSAAWYTKTSSWTGTTTAYGECGISSGVVTLKATGGYSNQYTSSVTFTNESDSQATLSFYYEASSYSSFSEEAASGKYSVVLDPGESCTLTIVGKRAATSNTATLTLSNFSLVAAAASSEVTINYDSSLGSVTVGGSAVAAGSTQTGSTSESITMVAVPNSGTTFLGWVDDTTGVVLGTSTTYTVSPANDMSVRPVFYSSTSTTAWFGVAGATQQSVSSGLLGFSKIYYYTVSTSYAYLFDDLNKAASCASNGTSKYIVLLNSGTLPTGTYTIPGGVSLLIPFDSDNTMYTTEVCNTGTYTTPTAYRTLTMADGANLIVNGALSISGKQKYAEGGAPYCVPTGPVGFVKMQGSSSITVNNGGALYAYGYVTGSGSVTAKSGATVYECFQITDFRGGTQSTDMDNNVFPLSQYYIQNIEVPLTLEYGAKEYGYSTIYMSSADFGSSMNFIGTSGALFNLSDGSLTKRYDGTTDRMQIEIDGSASISNISIQVSTYSVDSKDYVLALNGNMSITIKSGTTTINQDLYMFPGCYLTIASGATVSLGSGYRFYVYDADEWGNYVHLKNNSDCKMQVLKYSPTRTYTRTEDDLVDAVIKVNGTFDASLGSIYTTAGGAVITSDGGGIVKTTAGTEEVAYQFTQNDTTYHEIAITPAKLLNSNNTYTETTGASSTTYKYINGFWHKGGACTPNADDGDCTTPIKCSVCGAETTAANAAHSWDGGTVTVEATSTTPGVITYACTVTGCTQTKTEEIPATGGGEELPVYSVTITWSQTSTAKYTEGQTSYKWNTSDLKYTAETTAGGWNNTTSVVEITIDNSNSTGSVEAGFGYTATVGGSASWSGLTDSKLPVAAAGTGKATLTVTPTGDPGDLTNGASITLGTITITLTKEES